MNNLAFYTTLVLNKLRNERQLREQQEANQESPANDERRNKANEEEHKCREVLIG